MLKFYIIYIYLCARIIFLLTRALKIVNTYNKCKLSIELIMYLYNYNLHLHLSAKNLHLHLINEFYTVSNIAKKYKKFKSVRSIIIKCSTLIYIPYIQKLGG